ncbi:hypothetical protein [Micromonospora sp. NPDC004551]|uniref:response regulator transcription factor n=1 Tax=Micromonospora sp. NPDC004551 TaxID=3154284 RepID=UPI0033B27CF2
METRPDVAVLDLGMPGQDGLTAATGLRVALPSCRSLLVTALAVIAWETPDNPLTEREVQILRRAGDRRLGERDRAGALPVGRHGPQPLTSATTKLHARNRVDAIRIATETGWL